MKIKKFIFIKFIFIFIFLINSNEAGAGACDITVSSALTSQLACSDNDTLNVGISGSVIISGTKVINADDRANITIDNAGTLEAGSHAVSLDGVTGTNSITNSGTITSGARPAVRFEDGTNVTLNNSGTITNGSKSAVRAQSSINPTIINSGTIINSNLETGSSNGITFYVPKADGDISTGGTITNSGDIIVKNKAIEIGSNKDFNNLEITNSGLISGTHSIHVSNSTNTGLNIITKEDGTYTGEIHLSGSAATMTLDCSISKDQDIEIHEKNEMIIVNNLCGNDTYQILDANKNLDSDNSETNGYLRIFGEELDLASDNKKYRTEIFTNSIEHIFKSLSNIKEKSAFYSNSKRNDIYTNSIKGVSGYFLSNDYEEEKTRTFLTYFEQNVNFNSKEKNKSEKLAFGYDIKTNINNLSIKPLFGISSNKITDIETETEEIKRNNFLSQFFALHSNYKLSSKIQNNNDLSLTIIGEYGAHRLPKYVSNFTHGDLSVDEAIDQVLGFGFDVEYSIKNKNGFILEPYVGLAFNKTLSGKVKMNDINGAGLKEDISQDHTMNGTITNKIGFTLNKNTEDIGLSFNFEYSNQVNNNLNFSISKKF